MTIFAEVLGLGELQVRDYQIQNNWLLEQLKLSRKKLFGKSTEQADEAVMDQLSFVFNETEAMDAKSVEDAPSESKVKSYIRKRRSGSIEDVIPENLPIDRVEHRLPEEELLCAICRNQMVEIGKEIHRTLKIEPLHCKQYETETDEALIVKTPNEPTVLTGSFASPEAIAHIMTWKFVTHPSKNACGNKQPLL